MDRCSVDLREAAPQESCRPTRKDLQIPSPIRLITVGNSRMVVPGRSQDVIHYLSTSSGVAQSPAELPGTNTFDVFGWAWYSEVPQCGAADAERTSGLWQKPEVPARRPRPYSAMISFDVTEDQETRFVICPITTRRVFKMQNSRDSCVSVPHAAATEIYVLTRSAGTRFPT